METPVVAGDDIVITGIGCVTPIGIGRDAFWQALLGGRCGTRGIAKLSTNPSRVLYGATIEQFDGKDYVTPRKALKLMGREVQLSVAAAKLAWHDAGLEGQSIEPERIGVIFGSEILPGDISEMTEAIRRCSDGAVFDPTHWGERFGSSIFPLWMLRYLPNMPPCHIAIAVDARGPNNTIAQEEISGLLALGEAVRVMQRGDADVMIVGALGARVTPTRLAYRLPGLYFESHGDDALNQHHCRPFDAQSSGIVPGEASVVLVLERRQHAAARNQSIHGRLLATSAGFGRPDRHLSGSSQAMAATALRSLRSADVGANDLACISAQGFSHPMLDRAEAAALGRLSDQVPVAAYSSYFGTAGAASGLLQLVAGILATSAKKVLPVLGFNTPSASCPIQVCPHALDTRNSFVLQLSFTPHGQTAAALVDCR